jgi:hypothetical protein
VSALRSISLMLWSFSSLVLPAGINVDCCVRGFVCIVGTTFALFTYWLDWIIKPTSGFVDFWCLCDLNRVVVLLTFIFAAKSDLLEAILMVDRTKLI